MIINKGSYQIAQITGEKEVCIFHKKTLIKKLPARENLSYSELEKVLQLYTGTEVANESNG